MIRCTLALAALALLAGCSSTEPTAQDRYGHYATTSDYRSMDRVQLTAAMDAGLADVDKRREQLEARAETLGQDAIDELHDHEAKLSKLRTEFVNELTKLRAALDADWKDRREDTVDSFEDLRKSLDNAYEEVLDEV
jgi:DNA anti-recombination protein RmuC